MLVVFASTGRQARFSAQKKGLGTVPMNRASLTFQTDTSDVSRPSTCSTQGPNRKLSALTESYDGDTESFISRAGSEEGNYDVYSNCCESVSSPAFQMIPQRRVCFNEATVIQEPSPLSESDSENEASTSNTSVVDYTDSDFCRVQRPAGEGFIESRKMIENKGSCESESASCESRIDSVVTLLQHAKVTNDETSNTRFYDVDDSNPEPFGIQKRSFYSTLHDHERKDKEFWAKNPVCSEGSSTGESSSSPACEKSDEEPKLTLQEIMEKQRDLRSSVKETVKEAKKTIRKARAKRYAYFTNPRYKKAEGKPRNERVKEIKVNADSKQKKSSSHDPTKTEDVRMEKPAKCSPRSDTLLRKRRKREAVEMERRHVHILIAEMKYLNLHEQAEEMKSALESKENQEKEYDILLEVERQNIKRRKYIEMCRQKQEAKKKRLEELRRIEEERRVKEDIERTRRVEEAKKRREKNRMLWESYNAALLANSITKSFTFSYFPKLQRRPVDRPQIEPQKVTHSARVRRAREKHGGMCHQ